DAACREAQSRVSFAGTDEDRVAKRRALTFVVVREPPVVWWRWEPAWTVVVARALRDVEARGALEGFARHGGRVVLVEDRLADAGFLAAYRGGEPGRPQPIGQGRVARVPSLGSAALDGPTRAARGRAGGGARRAGADGRVVGAPRAAARRRPRARPVVVPRRLRARDAAAAGHGAARRGGSAQRDRRGVHAGARRRAGLGLPARRPAGWRRRRALARTARAAGAVHGAGMAVPARAQRGHDGPARRRAAAARGRRRAERAD